MNSYFLGFNGTFVAIAAAVFMAIVFLQSGFDKIFDYKGNLEYLKSHFAKTWLGKTTGLMLPVITILEIGGGLFCLAGIIMAVIDFRSATLVLFWGFVIVLAALAALMLGQRIAKDYAGAGGLTGYICIALIGLFGTLV